MRVVRYRQEPEREDQAHQAMNVDLSTVNGAAVLMPAAVLRIAGNPENQGRQVVGSAGVRRIARRKKRK